MNVSDVMTSVPIAVRADATVEEAAKLMIAARISGLPAIDEEGTLVGMITEGDLIRRAELGTDGRSAGWLANFVSPDRAARDYARTHALSVHDVMSTDVIWTSPGTSLSVVAGVMDARRVKRLPVMRDGRLIGIVSRADLLRALAKRLAESMGAGTAP